jgi:uncharacterized membrane protein YjfL (UPF0719 family)
MSFSFLQAFPLLLAQVPPETAARSMFHPILSSIIYVLIGMVFFALSFWIMERVTPFSIRKEIEEDQNTALAIIIGSMIIGIAIIISAAIHG